MAKYLDFVRNDKAIKQPLLSQYIEKIWNLIPTKNQIIESASKYFDGIYSGSGSLYIDTLNMLHEFNPEVLFRGQANVEYDIIPSLGRNDNFVHERDFIELPQVERPDIFNPNYKPLEKLALLQHYGIPTRLLDVTSNFLVALFFACQKTDVNRDVDGEIILFFDMHSYSSIYPLMEAHADTYLLTDGHDLSLNDFYKRALKRFYFSEDKYKSLYSKQQNQIRGFLYPVVVNPPRYSLRHRVQQGKFFLFPNTIRQDAKHPYIEASISKIEKNSALCKSVQVPCEHKQMLLSELSILGINKAKLFPDSLDMFSSELVKSITIFNK